ncbi:MAG: flagellar biosynthesis protein FlhB [Desulfobacteraceae bacterium]|nr:MAG: flagellar biosynthesis protein FlhB [Desulfobacteraceae bacterium]
MAEASYQDKTEPATGKKREDARKKGDVAKSRELGSVAVLLAGVIYLIFNCKSMTIRLGEQIKQVFALIPQVNRDDFNLVELVNRTVLGTITFMLPMMLTLFAAAVLANYLQIGLLWSTESLTPQFSKLNPVTGLERLFSKRALVELVKSILKLLIVSWAAFSVLHEEMKNMVPLLYQDKIQIFAMLGGVSLKVVMRCCWVILIMAILDYAYQKWDYEQKLKMTKQEVKDEFKHAEGDPLIKGRIRSMQRDMARRRMMQEVPKADVVITNPIHLAVALRYEPKEMAAPKIVAKGAERIAERIKEIAGAHKIPLVENRTLAQNLYKLDLGQEVPAHFYQAVAEILAYVYKLKKKIKRA